MVGWTGKDYKYDFDVQGFLRHSVIYFGMAATVFYVIRFAFWMINRYTTLANYKLCNKTL